MGIQTIMPCSLLEPKRGGTKTRITEDHQELDDASTVDRGPPQLQAGLSLSLLRSVPAGLGSLKFYLISLTFEMW